MKNKNVYKFFNQKIQRLLCTKKKLFFSKYYKWTWFDIFLFVSPFYFEITLSERKKMENQYTLFLWKTHIPLSGTKEVTFWPISSHYLNISDGWTTTSWATFPIQLCRRRHNHYHPLFICKYVFSIPIYVYFLYLPELKWGFYMKTFFHVWLCASSCGP